MTPEYDLKKVLPHKPPMILIDDVVEIDLPDKSLTSIVKITEDKVFFDKTINGISPTVGIEFMAQTIGCYSYFCKNIEEPEIGFLLGARLYKTGLERFDKDETYTIKVREVSSEYEIRVFDCIIYNSSNEECVSSTLNVYQNEETAKMLIGE